MSPVARSIVVAGAAMLAYGGWAFAVNLAHGSTLALRAAATQAFVSFTLTFAMTALMELLHRRARSRLSKFVSAAAGAIGLSFAYTVGLHVWMGSPELVATVAPSLAIGSAYAILYSANLLRITPTRARRPAGRDPRASAAR